MKSILNFKAGTIVLMLLAGIAGTLNMTQCTPIEGKSSEPKQTTKKIQKRLGAYYFGAGYFTLVPKNIRADLDEMKSWGTDIVCIGITENDIKYNDANIKFIVTEAHKRNMQVFAVPSRMAGITAGQPIEPPLFGYHHPHTATINKQGEPIVRKTHGILSSFYHPEVSEYLTGLTIEMVKKFKLDGIIWDEPKSTFIGWQDYSPLALKNNPDSSYVTYIDDFVDFFSQVNMTVKREFPELTIVHFDEACRNDTVIEKCATIKGIDIYGSDGKPYPAKKSKHSGNRATKVLPVYGEKYLKAARKNYLQSMMLIENQYLTGEQLNHMEQHLPEIINYDVDLLLYYYYGFYKDDTERNMQIIKENITNFKKPIQP